MPISIDLPVNKRKGGGQSIVSIAGGTAGSLTFLLIAIFIVAVLVRKWKLHHFHTRGQFTYLYHTDYGKVLSIIIIILQLLPEVTCRGRRGIRCFLIVC